MGFSSFGHFLHIGREPNTNKSPPYNYVEITAKPAISQQKKTQTSYTTALEPASNRIDSSLAYTHNLPCL